MRFYTALFVLLYLNSCTNENLNTLESDFIETLPQEWELSSMTLGMQPGNVSGEDLPYQETLVLKENNSFLKTRLTSDKTITGEGTFSIKEDTPGTILVLEYDSETDLIESCTGEKLIEKFLVKDSNLLTGGSAACDGPGLLYKRKY
ncbi:hypothetical protein [Cytophaga sp. FL35]|uniref:hypothetical protein n=1 Tax=Cytophaga sp. FL35 TaxID=1904456 RepID=UPI001653557F|nr:hypothetical protein [Cytophaga sp. FL35]MBC7000394.1 hypothetical protein [Cytophaga sp. FL35]